ncbi:MAG: hypothetical protein OXM02_15215 [Bacteroidota bacterium]|nr:hypothetical protein [Bacteroidota bacterium]
MLRDRGCALIAGRLSPGHSPGDRHSNYSVAQLPFVPFYEYQVIPQPMSPDGRISIMLSVLRIVGFGAGATGIPALPVAEKEESCVLLIARYARMWAGRARWPNTLRLARRSRCAAAVVQGIRAGGGGTPRNSAGLQGMAGIRWTHTDTPAP